MKKDERECKVKLCDRDKESVKKDERFELKWLGM